MDIFPIKKLEWDEQEENWVEGEETIGYQAIAPDGRILAKGETISEVSESVLVSAYLAESNEENSRKIHLAPKLFQKNQFKGVNLPGIKRD